MELINKIRKSRKGFTLVEIIVVLVILAVLAAFTIPTMLGFVEDAKGKALIAEARMVYVAAQATATEYVTNGNVDELGIDTTVPAGGSATFIAENLGSTVVYGTGSAIAEPVVGLPAARTMYTYLSKDIAEPSPTSKPTTETASKDKVYWEITMGSTTNSAQVTKVEYIKDGYSITITEPAGTSIVTKLPKS